MPLFELKCRKCGEVYQVVAARQALGRAACPRCASEAKDRVFGGPAAPRKSSCNLRFG